jgi:PHD/YefM family antitoxin component YafN of YafNO toxin-antitoxin module
MASARPHSLRKARIRTIVEAAPHVKPSTGSSTSTNERIAVTCNGHEAAVFISVDDLAELEETIDVLSDPGALADIREAGQACARGDVVRGVEQVRRLRGRARVVRVSTGSSSRHRLIERSGTDSPSPSLWRSPTS